MKTKSNRLHWSPVAGIRDMHEATHPNGRDYYTATLAGANWVVYAHYPSHDPKAAGRDRYLGTEPFLSRACQLASKHLASTKEAQCR